MRNEEKERIKEDFLREMENFEIREISENDVIRHVRFGRKKGGSAYHFNLTTWPGYLAITGDMGCFIFDREFDMFEFFRNESLNINPHYWSEKISFNRRHDLCKTFCSEKLMDSCRNAYEMHIANFELSNKEKKKLWNSLREAFSQCSNESEVYETAMDFDECGMRFDSDNIPNSMTFTHNFIWCLYAIVWGIQKYDEGKENMKQGSIKETIVEKIKSYLAGMKIH